MPASHSMISDLYEPHERGGAMSVWTMGINLGVFFAFLLGGYIGHRFGWRLAFIGAGVVTLLVALLARFTIQEPTRTGNARSEALRRGPSATLLREAMATMWLDSAIRQVVLGAVLLAVVGYGALSWVPSFLVRTHGMSMPLVGAYLAAVIGIGGAIGTVVGGRLSDRFRQRDVRWSLWFIVIAHVAAKPLAFYFFLSSDTALALAAFVLPAMVGALYVGPSIAVLHNRTSAALGPAVSAIFLLLINLIGLGLGPLAVGIMSQWLYSGAPNSLGYALATLQIVGLWGSAHLWAAGQRLSRPAR